MLDRSTQFLQTANSIESLNQTNLSKASSIKNLLKGGGDTFVTGTEMKDVLSIV